MNDYTNIILKTNGLQKVSIQFNYNFGHSVVSLILLNKDF